MNSKSISLVQSTFARMRPQAAYWTRIFLRRVFQVEPGVRMIFGSQGEDDSDQWAAVFGWVVDSLDEPELLEAMVGQVARRTAAFGMSANHDFVFRAALLWTVAQALDDEFSGEVREAWIDFYAFLMGMLRKKSAEIELAYSH